ncbi:porin family protein, partial [Phocaeicola sp.]|uniref:porin family protein n=1 Tax=Phocaeicola sp. TaxID=2773926 RepID=UPI003AEF5555
LGLKYQYNITDQIRIEPSMTYFFKNDGLSMFDINANIHYLFPIASNVSLYPLAGFTYTNWHLDLGKVGDYDVSGSDGKFGVNLGAGMEFTLDKSWSLNLDIKYQLISDLDQAVFNLGVAYNF